MSGPTTLYLRVIVLYDAPHWVAFALEHDVCAQGQTSYDSALNLRRVIDAELQIAKKQTVVEVPPLSWFPPAPQEYFEMWRQGGSIQRDFFWSDNVGVYLMIRTIPRPT